MRNLSFKLFISCILLGSYYTFAQSNNLQATVTDEQNDPLANVTIQVQPSGKVFITDGDGKFSTYLPNGNYVFVFSFVGFETMTRSVAIKSGQPVSMVVKLPVSSSLLETVSVRGQREEDSVATQVRLNIMPVTILTSRQIENRAGNLNEVLARQAGVQIRMSGGLGSDSRISVRGLEGKRVQIFLDGNPLNTPDGSLGINDLPVQIIERIEIYKGAVPAYLGGDGLGSAVNVVLKHREVSYIDATVSRQSYNTQALGLIIKKTFDKQGIEVGAGVFDTRSDNDYTMLSPYQPGLKIKRDHDKYRSLLAGGAIRFHRLWFDEIEVEGAYLLNDKQIQGIQQNIQGVESRGEAGVVAMALTKKNFAKDKLGLRYNLIYGQFNIQLVDTSSYNYEWDGTQIPSRLGKGELGNGPNLSVNLQKDLRQRLNLDYKLSTKHTLNFNNTARYVTFDPNDSVGNNWAEKNLYNFPGSIRNSTTGITLESRFLNDRFLLSAAAKHYYNFVEGYNTSIYLNNSTPDRVRNISNQPGYVVGTRYNFSNELFTKFSHERGVRLPNRTELFGDGILITPNTNLRPEISYNFNGGLVYDYTHKDQKRLQAEVNGFYMQVDNLIQLAGNGLTLGYVNYAKASIMGADVDVKYDITKTIYASFNATYQLLRDINQVVPGTSVENPTYKLAIPNVPQFFGNWNIEYHRDNWIGHESRTRIIYDGSYVHQYNFGFQISIYDKFIIPSYLTHTVALEQSFHNGRYTITGEVNNITDEVVINNFNQPLMGRTFRIKLRFLLLGNKSFHNH
jgi:vitamin B12 transporter